MAKRVASDQLEICNHHFLSHLTTNSYKSNANLANVNIDGETLLSKASAFELGGKVKLGLAKADSALDQPVFIGRAVLRLGQGALPGHHDGSSHTNLARGHLQSKDRGSSQHGFGVRVWILGGF